MKKLYFGLLTICFTNICIGMQQTEEPFDWYSEFKAHRGHVVDEPRIPIESQSSERFALTDFGACEYTLDLPCRPKKSKNEYAIKRILRYLAIALLGKEE